MNLPSKRLKIPGFDKNVEAQDIQSILNIFPEAALLFNPLNQRILFSNTTLTQDCLYKVDELSRMKVAGLLPKYDELELKTNTSTPHIVTMPLLRKDNTSEDFQVTIHFLSNNIDLGLLTMVPERLAQLNDFNSHKTNRLLCDISLIHQILKQDDIEKVINAILLAVCSITNSNCAGFYQAGEDQPQLKLLASVGSFSESFPNTLPLRELIQRQSILSWNSNTLPATRLQELAKEKELSNLTTVLVGEENASIGLIVLTSPPSVTFHSAREYLSEIAKIATIIIQRLSWSSSLIAQKEELIKEKGSYQAIFNCVSNAVIILSNQFSIIDINQAFIDMLGYSKEELIGQSVEKILVSDEEFFPLLKQNSREVPVTKSYNLKLFRRAGDSFPALLKIVPYSNTNSVINYIIAIEDQSHEEKLHTQIHLLEDQALLGQNQSKFAHEVRNAINAIGAGLQYVSGNLKPEDPNFNRIGLIKQDLDNMTALMETILTFTKITESEMEELNLGFLLTRVLDKYQYKFKQAKIHRHLQVEEGLPIIYGHRRSLEQVFINLIDNASREMKEQGGTLAVKVRYVTDIDQGDFIETSIADSGMGIPGEEKDRIFQPFHTTSPTGTGLGLIISKQLIEAHHGEIVCNSYLGGTIFFVRIPVYKKQ